MGTSSLKESRLSIFLGLWILFKIPICPETAGRTKETTVSTHMDFTLVYILNVWHDMFKFKINRLFCLFVMIDPYWFVQKGAIYICRFINNESNWQPYWDYVLVDVDKPDL